KEPMLTAARKYVSRHAEIAASGDKKRNKYAWARLPAVLFLMAYGPDDVLAPLLKTTLDKEEAWALVVAAQDIGPFIDYWLHESRFHKAQSIPELDFAASTDASVQM